MKKHRPPASSAQRKALQRGTYIRNFRCAVVLLENISREYPDEGLIELVTQLKVKHDYLFGPATCIICGGYSLLLNHICAKCRNKGV